MRITVWLTEPPYWILSLTSLSTLHFNALHHLFYFSKSKKDVNGWRLTQFRSIFFQTATQVFICNKSYAIAYWQEGQTSATIAPTFISDVVEEHKNYECGMLNFVRRWLKCFAKCRWKVVFCCWKVSVSISVIVTHVPVSVSLEIREWLYFRSNLYRL